MWLSEKTIKSITPFPTIHLFKAWFSLYASSKTVSYNTSSAEANIRIQLFPIKPDSKEIFKNVQPTFLNSFFLFLGKSTFH